MGIAIGMIEVNSIAQGILASDIMVKSANIELIRNSTICPGKFVVIISGETSDVETAINEGKSICGHMLVDELIISNVHSQVIPAISLTNQVENYGAIGVLEYYSVASAILAADKAAKASNVTLIEIRIGYAIGGKGFVTMTGSVSDVEEAVNAGIEISELLVNSVVIPRPDAKVFESLL